MRSSELCLTYFTRLDFSSSVSVCVRVFFFYWLFLHRPSLKFQESRSCKTVYTMKQFCFWKPLYSKHWVRLVLIYYWYQFSGTSIFLYNSVVGYNYVYTTITWCSSFIHWLVIFSLKIRTNSTLISMFHQYIAQIYALELQDYFPNSYIIILLIEHLWFSGYPINF